jgi:hypothetical protein
MAEFRKAVISSKRMGSSTAGGAGSPVGTFRSSSQGNLQSSQKKGGMGDSPKKEIRFEMTHEPS